MNAAQLRPPETALRCSICGLRFEHLDPVEVEHQGAIHVALAHPAVFTKATGTPVPEAISAHVTHIVRHRVARSN